MPRQGTITIRENEWQVSLATTYSELTRGLGGLESIPSGTGMLFVFAYDMPAQVTTAPMLFNLDIIFISSALEVASVARDIPPGMIVSEATPVRYFLEVNAGEAENVNVGDMVEMTLPPAELPTLFEQGMRAILIGSMLGFVAGFMVGVGRLVFGHEEKELPQTKEEAPRFIGGCKIIRFLCHTHGYSVSKEVKCPESPLTDEEWAAAWELVESAFPEGMSNPWLNGWWPKDILEAERAVRNYADSLWRAFRKYESAARKAIENYRRSAKKAIYNYREYVMGEYERGKELAPSPQAQYFTDTEDTINNSGLMFQSELDDAFIRAITRARKFAGAAGAIRELGRELA